MAATEASMSPAAEALDELLTPVLAVAPENFIYDGPHDLGSKAVVYFRGPNEIWRVEVTRHA